MSSEDSPVREFLAQIARALESHQRPTPETHVLAHGRRFKSQDMSPAERAVLGRLTRRDCRPKQCYANAQRIALRLLGRTPPDIKVAYCEGYVCWKTSIAIPHAWLSVNGKLADPTLRWDNGKPVLGRIPDRADYLGVELAEADLLHISSHSIHIALLDDWQCGWPLLQPAPLS